MKYLTLFLLSLLGPCLIGLQGLTIAQNMDASRANKQPTSPLHELIQGLIVKKVPFESLDWFTRGAATHQNRYERQLHTATTLRLDRRKLEQYVAAPARNITFQIPLPDGQKTTLQLTKVQLISEGFEAVSASGKHTLVHAPGIFYHGIVQGEPGSIASVSMFRNHVRILIANDQGNQIIQQDRTLEGGDWYIMYNDRHLKHTLNAFCQTPDRASGQRLMHNDLSPSDASNCVKVYLECDFALYQNNSSAFINTVDYALELFSESQLIFRNEDVKVELSKIFVWDEEDPYATTDCGNVLDAFVDNRPTFEGDLAHLISSKFTDNGDGISLCGRAYGIGGICGGSSDPGPYCVSLGLLNPILDFPVYSWELNIFTHEMGHVLGSRHTHACVWNGNDTQIDDCGNQTAFDNGSTPEGNSCFDEDSPILPMDGGFIMSYCHQISAVGMNFSFGFGPQSGDVIRSTIMSAGCLSSSCSCDDFTDRVVSDTPIAPAVYNASNLITSAGQAITPGATVLFQAGHQISLEEGFAAEELFVAQVVDTLCESGGSSLAGGSASGVMLHNSPVPPGMASHIKVWPNPASGSVQIEYELRTEQNVQLQLLDLHGKPVVQQLNFTRQAEGIHLERLTIGHLPAGLYQLVLRYGDRYITKPLIIDTL